MTQYTHATEENSTRSHHRPEPTLNRLPFRQRLIP